jgi:hypothetical protein
MGGGGGGDAAGRGRLSPLRDRVEGLGSKRRGSAFVCAFLGWGRDGVATGAAIYSSQGGRVRGGRAPGPGPRGRARADSERLPGWPEP